MIRAAKFVDIPRLTELIHQMHDASRYKGRVGIDPKHCQAILMGSIQRSPGSHAGGSLVNVTERNGQVSGFMVGLLDPIYHIGTKLAAKDAYLYVSPGRRDLREMNSLIDAYIAWAEANPKVIDVNLSWTDALPGAERIARVYERKGFRLSGGIYERAVG